MKKTVIALSSFAIILSSASCERELGITDPMNVTVDFKAQFDNEDLVFFEENTDVLGHSMTVEGLRAYFSDIALIDVNGDFHELEDLIYIDFSSNTVSINGELPVGDYNGIRFNIGVPQELNGTANPDFDPVNYAPDHPLALNNQMYWAWATGYRFMIYEGRVDTTPGSINPNDLPVPYSIHMGVDTTYTAVQLPLEINNATDADILLTLDVSDCMHGPQDTLLLFDSQQNTFHGSGLDVALRFKHLMENSWEVSVD